MKTSSCSWTWISRWNGNNLIAGNTVNRRKGITPTCHKCKRRVVDNTETKQSCKLKKIHLWWKQLWRLRLWGDGTTRGSHEVRERNREGFSCADVATQGRTGAAQTKEWIVVGTCTIGGETCINGWNYTHTSYRSILAVGVEQTRCEVMLIACKGIQQHACHCVHACDRNHLSHSSRQRQEEISIGAKKVLWQVDTHGH